MAEENVYDGNEVRVKHLVQYAYPYMVELLKKEKKRVESRRRDASRKPVDLNGMALASAELSVLEKLERTLEKDLEESER